VTCKLNERYALNTKLTKSTIEEQNIVVLKADMTHDAPDIEEKLIEFGNTAKAIPYYAVYRPGQAPHHFDGNFVTVGAKGFLERAGIIASGEPAKVSVVEGPMPVYRAHCMPLVPDFQRDGFASNAILLNGMLQ
jgi:hypothetical protein